MDSNNLSYTKWNCKYHIVFAQKFRRKIIYEQLKRDIANILSTLCKRKGVHIVEAEMCSDHVHMLVEIPPRGSLHRRRQHRVRAVRLQKHLRHDM